MTLEPGGSAARGREVMFWLGDDQQRLSSERLGAFYAVQSLLCCASWCGEIRIRKVWSRMGAFFAFTALAMVLHLGVATGQASANASHNRYPAPTVDDMEVRPEISLTVQYGPDQIAFEMRIHPTSASLLVTEPESMMVPETVKEII